MHLSAAVMSAPTSIDAYDAQMLDFSSDPDVPMHITGTAELFAEALMDHDGHLATPVYGEHPSIEVDMEEYVGDNAEYEMADETAEYHRSHGDELLDVEVYDASHASSPLAHLQPLQPSVGVPVDSEPLVSTSPTFSEHAVHSELRNEVEPEVHVAPLDHSAADAFHVEPSASLDSVSSEATTLEFSHLVGAPEESVPPSSEVHDEAVRTNGQSFETLRPADADEHAGSHVFAGPDEQTVGQEVAQRESAEPPTADSAPLASTEAGHDSGPPAQDEKVADQVSEPAVDRDAVDPLHISDGVYIDPPLAVLLSIADLAEPAFALFNQPHLHAESTEGSHPSQKDYSLLLEDRPALYFEPLSSVFEALRQNEALLSRVPHSFEGELVLDAYDLQLVVSEDNVHSREISLHDLHMLHDGSDFAGPLRLLLRAIVPRFIIRYYALQEQIQQLNVAAETGEGEHDEDHHERYDTGEEHPQSQSDEAAELSFPHAATPSEGLKEAEELVKEPVALPESTEEASREIYETDDGFGAQEHTADDQITQTLEDEDDYEGTNAGDEDESAKGDALDAHQVHETAAEDTGAPETVIRQESKFGGEQSEYLDYVQQEEYDERYGEDLPERAGGDSSVQYGEPPHHEEEGDHDTSTTVDETHAILPGSDEGDDDQSSATPLPVRAVLEHTDYPPASTIPFEQDSARRDEELVPSESKGKVAYDPHDTDIEQGKIFLEVEESDLNFVSLLEREADAAFVRTFDAAQSGQEGSTEVTHQHDEAWDEWDDEDAEGEDDADWVDPDAGSNESSITLSSKSSSKRNYEEVESTEEAYVEDPRNSPGPKRPRVQ